jgi:hypothetical protein
MYLYVYVYTYAYRYSHRCTYVCILFDRHIYCTVFNSNDGLLLYIYIDVCMNIYAYVYMNVLHKYLTYF